MTRMEELQETLKQIENAEEEDIFPLGKNMARLEATVEIAVQAADDIIMEGCDGSTEELNYVTGWVAARILEKAIQPLRMAFVKKDLFPLKKEEAS